MFSFHDQAERNKVYDDSLLPYISPGREKETKKLSKRPSRKASSSVPPSAGSHRVQSSQSSLRRGAPSPKPRLNAGVRAEEDGVHERVTSAPDWLFEVFAVSKGWIWSDCLLVCYQYSYMHIIIMKYSWVLYIGCSMYLQRGVRSVEFSRCQHPGKC